MVISWGVWWFHKEYGEFMLNWCMLNWCMLNWSAKFSVSKGLKLCIFPLILSVHWILDITILKRVRTRSKFHTENLILNIIYLIFHFQYPFVTTMTWQKLIMNVSGHWRTSERIISLWLQSESDSFNIYYLCIIRVISFSKMTLKWCK